MADAFTGEIRIFGFNYAPQDWALCNGQSMPLMQNQVLYTVIGTAFGGDGQTTFSLPNLMGRTPLAANGSADYSETDGTETVALTYLQTPVHNHTVAAASGPVTFATQTQAASATSIFGRVGTATTGVRAYSNAATPNVTMDPQMVGIAGSGAAHENRQPFLTMNFCICLSGLYPVRP